MDEIKDVPADRVGQIVQAFVDEGKASTSAVKQADGKWTVSAN